MIVTEMTCTILNNETMISIKGIRLRIKAWEILKERTY